MLEEIGLKYLDLFDVILDPFDRVAIDIIARVNLVASHHFCPDH